MPQESLSREQLLTLIKDLSEEHKALIEWISNAVNEQQSDTFKSQLQNSELENSSIEELQSLIWSLNEENEELFRLKEEYADVYPITSSEPNSPDSKELRPNPSFLFSIYFKYSAAIKSILIGTTVAALVVAAALSGGLSVVSVSAAAVATGMFSGGLTFFSSQNKAHSKEVKKPDVEMDTYLTNP